MSFTYKVAKRFWSKVDRSDGDDPDTCWPWTGQCDAKGYGLFWDGYFTMLASRYSVALDLGGPIPDGLDVDHRCRNTVCVRPSHLRAVTRKQNLENRPNAQRNSASGVRGVFWRKQRSRWIVQVQHNGKHYHGGSFKDIEEANTAAIALRNQLFTCNDSDRV